MDFYIVWWGMFKGCCLEVPIAGYKMRGIRYRGAAGMFYTLLKRQLGEVSSPPRLRLARSDLPNVAFPSLFVTREVFKFIDCTYIHRVASIQKFQKWPQP